MSSVIRIKRSEVSGNPAVLGTGELAYSALPDNGSNGGDRLYIGIGVETAGNAASHVVIGGKYFTDMISAATSAATPNTLVLRDSSGNIAVTSITGNVNGNAASATKLANSRSISITGDASWTVNFDGSANATAGLTLNTVNLSPGTFGSATTVPIVTVNGKGLVTSITTASIASTLNISDGTNLDGVSLLNDTLVFTGSTGVTTTVSNNQVSFAIGQAVATTSDVTFHDVTVNGTLYSNDITASSVSVDGNAVITGNLTVQGTTTTVNSTTVVVADKNIVLAKDAATAAAAEGGGITVNGPAVPASLTYSSADDRWNLNKNLNVGTVFGALSGNADTATKLLNARNFSVSGDATTAAPVSFDGTGSVDLAITLATVNSNVGSFGNGTTIPNFTVDGKGRITAAGSTAIPTATTTVSGLAKFSSNNFSVTAGLVEIIGLDGGVY